MNHKNWLRTGIIFMAAVFLTACLPGFGAALAADHSWNNSYFAIDDENIYEGMIFPGDGSGKIYMPGKNKTVYLPLIYLPENSSVVPGSVRVLIQADDKAEKNMKILKYDIKAKKAFARNDPARQAWVVEWRPSLNGQTTAGKFPALIRIEADIDQDGGRERIMVEEELQLIFRDYSPDDGESQTDESETGESLDTGTPSESENTGDTQESGQPQETEDTGESGGTGETGESGETGGRDESGEPDETGGNVETGESGEPGETDGGGETAETEVWDTVPGETFEDETRGSQTGELQDVLPDGGMDMGGIADTSGGAVSWGGAGAGQEDPQAPPKLRIIDCTVDKEEIYPGDDVEIYVTLKNSSAKSCVEDVRIVYESATGEVLPAGSSNSIYVDYIAPGGTCNISFPMEVGYTLTSETQKITLAMEFTDEDAQALSSSESIFLKITPSFDVLVDQPSMAASVESGTAQDITVKVYNTGGSLVKNVICSLEMDGVTGSGSAFGGDIVPGENTEIVLHTLIGKLTRSVGSGGGATGSAGENDIAGDENPDLGIDGNGQGMEENGQSLAGKSSEYGQTTGTVVVRYEDEAGNEYTQKVSVTTQITPPEGEANPVEPVEKSSQWWVSIVLGLVAVQVVIFILIGVHRRRNV